MKSIILFCAAYLIAFGAFAQTTINTTTIKSGIMKKSGSVWIVKLMTEDETMSNGLLVKTTGEVKTPKGKTIELGNGDYIGMNGKIVGLNEKGITSAVVKNGKMWVVTKLEEPLMLSDGTIVLPNGAVKNNTGTTVLLKNNEIMDIAGNKLTTWKPVNAMALNK